MLKIKNNKSSVFISYFEQVFGHKEVYCINYQTHLKNFSRKKY